MKTAPNPPLHWYSMFTAVCTFLLLVAGALVTSNDAGLSVPDWPTSYGSFFPPMVGGIFYEHGHRMVATFVGLLTIGLAVWLWRADSRRWMRWLGLTALVAVIAQGLLGALTVKFLLPPPVSVAHAGLAQSFFCLTVALALFTSGWWQSEFVPQPDLDSPRLKTLTVATVAATFLQLLLGAAFRHNAFGIVPHLIGAAVVLALVIIAGSAARRRFPESPPLRRVVIALHSLVGTQILLGGAAWWSRLATRDAPQLQSEMIWLTVVHTVLGALVLAASVLLALVVWRVLEPGHSTEYSVKPEQAAV
jgi:cytochrome c oxidase assembly protein subunit 15